MIDKRINKTYLRNTAKNSSNAMAKLCEDESFPLKILEKICHVLDCTLYDIIEITLNKE